jgi:hypothetical protein
MSLQTWQETLIAQPVDGAALANTTTATSILHPTARVTLPAQFFQVGRVLLLKAAGRISNIVTSPGTLTLEVRFGSAVVASSGAMALNVVAKTNVPWALEWLLTCRAIGSGTGANMMHQGIWSSESVIGSPLPSAGGAGQHMLPNAAPAVGAGFDSTAAQTVDLFATWSVANAGNSILTHQYKLVSDN